MDNDFKALATLYDDLRTRVFAQQRIVLAGTVIGLRATEDPMATLDILRNIALYKDIRDNDAIEHRINDRTEKLLADIEASLVDLTKRFGR